MDAILFWNQVSLDANKTDFSSDKPETPINSEQGGPTRTSRALAIVHLAMYDAYVGVTGAAATYLTYAPTAGTTNVDAARAAVSAAACETLSALYIGQRATFQKKHLEFVSMLTTGSDPDVELGLNWGRLVAVAMLDSRKGDGSDVSDDLYVPSAEPGRHRVDPQNPGQGNLGPHWGKVKPFGINHLTTVIPAMPHYALNSAAYKLAFDEVKAKGALTGVTRAPDETVVGVYWAYDGARNIGVPPRLYNQAVRAIAIKQATTEAANARLFAMANVAMADAGILAWHVKYQFNLWRPVVGIRESDVGWGPTGKGDGNSTAGDPFWVPLGAPRTNQPGFPGATPNFPAYPSGHATFGAAALRVVESELGLLNTFEFGFISDELNGESIDRDGTARARFLPNMTIDKAIQDNLDSRVWLGVHWRFDGTEGVRLGSEIATRIQTAFPAKA